MYAEVKLSMVESVIPHCGDMRVPTRSRERGNTQNVMPHCR